MRKSAIAALCALAISTPAMAAGFKHENNPEAPRIAQEFAEALGVSLIHH